jgi:hypothetical protein
MHRSNFRTNLFSATWLISRVSGSNLLDARDVLLPAPVSDGGSIMPGLLGVRAQDQGGRPCLLEFDFPEAGYHTAGYVSANRVGEARMSSSERNGGEISPFIPFSFCGTTVSVTCVDASRLSNSQSFPVKHFTSKSDFCLPRTHDTRVNLSHFGGRES